MPASGATASRPALACARSRASSGPKATSSSAASKGWACAARSPSPTWSNPANSVAMLLEGPGVETLGDGERYEGGFRAGKRHGYGQVTAADGKVHVRPLAGRKARRIQRLEAVAWMLRPTAATSSRRDQAAVRPADRRQSRPRRNRARAGLAAAGYRLLARLEGTQDLHRPRARTGARRRRRQHRQPEPRHDRGHAAHAPISCRGRSRCSSTIPIPRPSPRPWKRAFQPMW